MTTLGVILVSEHADLLRSLIAWLRNTRLFDQIVAVADADAGPEVEAVSHLADTWGLMALDHQEQAINYAISLCETDWIFRIDDDERVGDLFVSGVRELIEKDVIDALRLPRAWLWPDENHFISSAPWYPDYNFRLWRRGYAWHNDPQATHLDLSVRGRIASAEWNMFHYILLQRSFEERLAKCRRYAALMGQSPEDFRNRIGRYYLPEDANGTCVILPCVERPYHG